VFKKPAKMPSEVTDIKQFLEIARRKDAKGAPFADFPPTLPPVERRTIKDEQEVMC
jgi:hypothetical protein